MKIIVTADDLLKGDFVNPSDCPVARALKRMFPNKYVGVVISHATVGFPSEEGDYKYIIFKERFGKVDYLAAFAKAKEDPTYTLTIETEDEDYNGN